MHTFEVHTFDSSLNAGVKTGIISLLIGRDDTDQEQRTEYWNKVFEEDSVRVLYILLPSNHEIVIGGAVLRLPGGRDSCRLTIEALALRGSPTDPELKDITRALLEAAERKARLCRRQTLFGVLPQGSGNLPHAGGDDFFHDAGFVVHVVPGYHRDQQSGLRNALVLHKTLIPGFPNGVRLARKEDVALMATVSVEGFRGNEIFEYIRPHYSQYPEDTWVSQVSDFSRQLNSPFSVCLVAEREGTLAGLSCWDFREKSVCKGYVLNQDLDAPPDGQRRDEDPIAKKRLMKGTNDIRQRFFSNMWVCTKFVVLPQFQRKGVGSSMLRWARDCADMDDSDQGVISSNQGAHFYRNHGFSRVTDMVIKDAEGCVQLTQEVLVRKALS